MKQLINDQWKLLHREREVTSPEGIASADDFIDVGTLPCDVRMPLIRDGIIKDPVVADYCYESEWIEEKSWWFKREFTVSAQDLSGRGIRLVLESLDLYADVFINGHHIGSHKSCHYPFTAEIRKYVNEGVNTLLVRLTTDPDQFTPEQESYAKDYVWIDEGLAKAGRLESRRAFLRKPQYVYGWDWAPRVVTVGIMKNAYLEIYDDLIITDVHPVTLNTGKNAEMRFDIRFYSYRPISTIETQVFLDVYFEDEKILSLQQDVLAVSGVNFVSFDAVIENARLWWPTGAGEQPLYTISVTLKNGNHTYAAETVRTGIRTVSLNQSKYEDGTRRFAVRVNDIDIYCKGANWCPSDSIYARITPKKYETLISEARECNFNMLRVWGGSIYERDEFYDYCNQYGILVWQDFAFACAPYPDDQEWFRIETEKEMDYQTRRLRHHPCLALWCGNNENHWALELVHGIENVDKGLDFAAGLIIYNEIAPLITRNNCPEIPYWRSSPYGGERPNDNEVGDRHHWNDCTMNEDIKKRISPEEYDKVTSRFVSEYGYIGPCSDESIQKYFGGNDVVQGNQIWNLHNNTFEKDTVPAGIRKHYAEPDKLELADYLRYARLVQGLMYGYSLESIRFYERCGGSLFWMYNDAWGEVGWSVIDYYLDRKPSFYYIKRAYAPVKFILRFANDKKTVRVMGVNDTPGALTLNIEYGYAGFNGEFDALKKQISLEPFSKTIVFEFDMPGHDLRRGVIFARADTDSVPLSLLRTGDFKDYKPGESVLSIKKVEVKGRDYEVTIKSIGYSHAVSFGLEAAVRMSDCYFDMLPGDVRVITIYDALGKIDTDNIKVTCVNVHKIDK